MPTHPAVRTLASPGIAPLAAMILTIVAVVGALVIAPAATAAPQPSAWATLLADPAQSASTDYPDARFAPDAQAAEFTAALAERLASAPGGTPSGDADLGYLSDLTAIGIPTEKPTDAEALVRLGHAIVDDLHAKSNCGEVITIGLGGLKAGFTSYQAAMVVVSAAKWYAPDLLPLLKNCDLGPKTV